MLPDGGLLSRTNVQPAVQLDQIFNALDPVDTARIPGLAAAARDRGPRQRPEPQQRDRQPAAVRRRRDGHPAGARHRARGDRPAGPERRHRVRRAKPEPGGASQPDHERRSEFATTAANNNALAGHLPRPSDLPERDEGDVRPAQGVRARRNPLVKELCRSPSSSAPTLSAVRVLSPDLERLFVDLGPLITASKTASRRWRMCCAAPRRCWAHWVRSWSSSTRSSTGSRFTSSCSPTSSRSAPSASRRRRPPTAAAG